MAEFMGYYPYTIPDLDVSTFDDIFFILNDMKFLLMKRN